MNNDKVITIDGGSGTGKTTVSKIVAKNLKYSFISTGKIFRCMAYAFKEQNSKLFEEYTMDQIIYQKDYTYMIKDMIESFTFAPLSFDKYLVNGKEITDEDLNSEAIANIASKLSSNRDIRSKYEFIIREQIDKHPNGIIIEGRDCGTVICPESKNKFFLTCSIEKQVKNRMKDYNGINISEEELRQAIIQRDKENKERLLSPLVPAADAVLVDCSNLEVNQVVDKILNNLDLTNKKRS